MSSRSMATSSQIRTRMRSAMRFRKYGTPQPGARFGVQEGVIPPVLAAYQMLEVAPWASLEEVTRAYREKAKQYHPDLHPRRESHGPEAMVHLNRARQAVFER